MSKRKMLSTESYNKDVIDFFPGISKGILKFKVNLIFVVFFVFFSGE